MITIYLSIKLHHIHPIRHGPKYRPISASYIGLTSLITCAGTHTHTHWIKPPWASLRPSIVWLCPGMRFPDKAASEEATDWRWPVPPQHQQQLLPLPSTIIHVCQPCTARLQFTAVARHVTWWFVTFMQCDSTIMCSTYYGLSGGTRSQYLGDKYT